MQFFKNFFSSGKKNYDQLPDEADNLQKQLPVDEQFVVNYKQAGGRFFYPENMDELKLQLKALLKMLKEEKFIALDRGYYHFLKKLKLPVVSGINNKGILIGGCEYLIADEGAILVSSQNILNYRNNELPRKRVFIVTTDQIVKDKREALEKINKKYKDYPSNIQSFSKFSKDRQNDDTSAFWADTSLFLIEK